MIRAGRLASRVQFQQRVEVQNEVGEPTVTWVPLRTVWAAIEPTRAQEAIKADSVQGFITVLVTTRYHPDVTTADRICIGPDRYLDIQGMPKDVGNSHFVLEFICTEGLYKGDPA